MKKQTVMWTALPNGVTTSPQDGQPRLRVSVFISPRLQTDEGLPNPKLSQFPDFVDWPATVAGVQFAVQFDNAAPVAATVVPPPDSPPPSQLWQAIFTPNTYVKPYEFPGLDKTIIRSFPVRNMVAHIKSAYQNLAVQSPIAPPRLDLGPEAEKQQGIEPLRRLLQDVAAPRPARLQLRQQVDTQVRAAGLRATAAPVVEATEPGQTRVRAAIPKAAAAVVAAPALREVPQARLDFVQFEAFHGQLLDARHASRTPPQIILRTMDFHEIHTSLGDYPLLMRRLSFVIDLEVPVPAGAEWVKIVPTWTPRTAGEDVTPRTRCTVSPTEFRAVPGPDAPDLEGGMLKLSDDDRFEVGLIDVDGAAIKTLNLAETVRDGRAQSDAGLPSLRSAGIWVAQVNRAHEFSIQVLDRALQLEAVVQRKVRVGEVRRAPAASDRIGAVAPRLPAGDDPELYAEDLLRGYRVDVWDDATGEWRSVCERVGTYRFTRAGAGVAEPLELTDEGWVATIAAEAPEESEDALYLPETICRWEGWSLCAPRPGKAVPQDGVPDYTGNNYGLEVGFLARPGSLPRLRFGHEYRLRARLVDLAGNGLAPDQGTEAPATDPITYARHEPLASPVVLPREDISQARGETVDRLVIHSFNSSPELDAVVTEEACERHIAPPRTSQLMAETHGMFDGPSGMKGDAATYQLITSRDQAPESFYPADTFALPYLPDPIGLGVVVRFGALGSARTVEKTLRVPFSGEWPALQPFRIQIVEPTPEVSTPLFDEARRVLIIPLAKAEMADIVLSCYMPPPEVERMGMWHWTMQGLVEPAIQRSSLGTVERKAVRRLAPRLQELRTVQSRVALPQAEVEKAQKLSLAAIEAAHWMITPSRTLTLVHAVQQPLTTPDLANISSTRNIGATFARIAAHCPIDGKSTIKVDVEAGWDDPVDNITEPEPRIVQGQAHVCQIPIEADDTRLSVTEPMELAQIRPGTRLPSTRERVPEVTGAKPGVTEAKPGVTDVGPQVAGVVPIVLGRKHEFGDTRYRRVTYSAKATTRFGEYLPFTQEQINSGEQVVTRTSPGVAIDILSSARPAAPKLLYIVPTFGWERDDSMGETVTSIRRGGGLRVYLERPWYSSGDGELLGVVLLEPKTGPAAMTHVVADRTLSYVSHWGQDPIWRTGSINSALAIAHFPDAEASETGLTLDETPGQKVSVAGHKVGYDAERQLWYSDIRIDPGTSYYPFVRLALARYQPKSVQNTREDVKLSRVVVADFAQLAPDRTASVSFAPGRPRVANVTVTGGATGMSSAGVGPELEVSVEVSNAQSKDELTWLPALEAPVKLQQARGAARWTGTVTLPGDRGSKPYRLVIREYEVFEALQPGITAVAAPQVSRRLVYADALEV